MSVDTKLFVTCGNDKLVSVMNDVISHLNTYVRSKLDVHLASEGYENRIHFLHSQEDKSEWTNGCSVHAYNFDVITVSFGVGESRALKVFPNCYGDCEGVYVGDKIFFHLGCWGLSDEIMMVVAKAVAKYGDVYYDYNDCDDIDFVMLNVKEIGE